MKKYFCTETDELVSFGDTIHLVFQKHIEEGKVTIEKFIEFNEESIGFLTDAGFVEVRDVEENEAEDKGCLDFSDEGEETCRSLSQLIENFNSLVKRVDKLEALNLDVLKDTISVLTLSALKSLVKGADHNTKSDNDQPKKK